MCLLFINSMVRPITLSLRPHGNSMVCPITLSLRPHGNCKRSKAYRRTRESTKDQLKNELENNKPKDAVDNVFRSKGGVLEVQSAGELPRGRTQAYNIKRALQHQKLSKAVNIPTSLTRDMLFVVMQQCKNAEKTETFVQDVACAPEPMSVLCSEQQLNDVTRFCCDSFNFSIFGVDPTFNLGDFSVTPTTYRHLLLEHSKTGQSPILLGPLLVHYQKLFRSYNYFFSTLSGLKKEVIGIKAIGTDGEKNLVDAALHNFPHAVHLRCFRHLQQNVELHLRNEQFPQPTIKEFTHDIFGWTESNGTYHEGLVDSQDI